MKRFLVRWIPALILFFLPVTFFPAWWCGREADSYYLGQHREVYQSLAEEVAVWVRAGVSDKDFHTGNWQFNGEWSFGTFQMAALGFCQMVKMFPETRATYCPLIEDCLDAMLATQTRGFDSRSWNEDPLTTLDGPNGHVAYLGYLNLPLGAYREIASDSRFNDLNDRITAALVRRIASSSFLLIPTYPAEVYPVDNAAAIGSIGLYERVTGRTHGSFLASWTENCRRQFLDPASGLLVQSVDPRSGKPLDKPRASGSALAIYFLGLGGINLSEEMYKSVRRNVGVECLGFGALREYPGNVDSGDGDIDSGPLVFGLSMSGTGFILASARSFHDREFFSALFRTAWLAGYPIDWNGRRYFSLGGPLGTAIMLAMTTSGGIQSQPATDRRVLKHE